MILTKVSLSIYSKVNQQFKPRYNHIFTTISLIDEIVIISRINISPYILIIKFNFWFPFADSYQNCYK